MAVPLTNPHVRTIIIVTLVIALSIGVLVRQHRDDQAGAKPVPLAAAAAQEDSVPDSPLELVVADEVPPARTTIASRGMDINPERADQILISDPYYPTRS